MHKQHTCVAYMFHASWLTACVDICAYAQMS